VFGRLRWFPAQIADGRSGEGDTFVGDDVVVEDTLEEAGFDSHSGRRCGEAGCA
jgi:hypothetical protein